MILKEILKNLKNVKVFGDENIIVKDVFSDSKQLTKNSLFVSTSNTKEEKINEIMEAADKGAAAIVLEDEELIDKIPKEIVKVLVSKTNIAKAAIACNFFENPSTKMHVIGITGTKGKTMTAMLLREVLVLSGKKVGLITNLYNAINDKIISKEKKFLDAIDLQRLLAEMVKEKQEYVIIEVPETSIKENKVLGCKFTNVIFTNLNSDSIILGDNQSLENYIENQKKIFKWSDLNVVNNDDFFADDIVELSKKAATYGVANKADYTAIDINCRSTRVDFLTFMEGKSQRIRINIPGRYMVYNALSVAVLAMQLGISSKHVIQALMNAIIPGVYEVIENKQDIPVIINGTKTIKEIEETLIVTRPYSTGNITTIIGSDDSISNKEREFIGEVLGRLSDNTIVTTYNPRDKDPESLGKDILSGIRKVNGKGIQITNRKEAIEFALSKAQRRDLILLLGMGDEKFLEIGNEHVVFDERKIVEDFFKQQVSKETIVKDALKQQKVDLKERIATKTSTKPKTETKAPITKDKTITEEKEIAKKEAQKTKTEVKKETVKKEVIKKEPAKKEVAKKETTKKETKTEVKKEPAKKKTSKSKQEEVKKPIAKKETKNKK